MKNLLIAFLLILSITSCNYLGEEIPDNSQIVYVTNTGGKYHNDGCQYLNHSKISMTETNAIYKGYTKCSFCWNNAITEPSTSFTFSTGSTTTTTTVKPTVPEVTYKYKFYTKYCYGVKYENGRGADFFNITLNERIVELKINEKPEETTDFRYFEITKEGLYWFSTPEFVITGLPVLGKWFITPEKQDGTSFLNYKNEMTNKYSTYTHSVVSTNGVVKDTYYLIYSSYEKIK